MLAKTSVRSLFFSLFGLAVFAGATCAQISFTELNGMLARAAKPQAAAAVKPRASVALANSSAGRWQPVASEQVSANISRFM